MLTVIKRQRHSALGQNGAALFYKMVVLMLCQSRSERKAVGASIQHYIIEKALLEIDSKIQCLLCALPFYQNVIQDRGHQSGTDPLPKG